MGFIQKTLDLKKLARTLKKRAADPEWESRFLGSIKPGELSPVMFQIYLQVLRFGEINIAALDFDEIGEGDIDELESVLADNPSHALFELSEVFRELAPSVAGAQAFI